MLDRLELYLATMALRGKKYRKAAALYSKVAVRSNSVEAWVCMGICQLYQLSAGITMDEVIFCFNKAKSINPSLQKAIEAKLISSCQMVLTTYVAFFNEALKQQILENKKVGTALLLTGNNLLGQQSHCEQFSSFASLGIEGVCVAPFKKKLRLEKLQTEILLRFYEMDNALRIHVDQASEAFTTYEKMELIVLKIDSVQMPGKNKKKRVVSGLLAERASSLATIAISS